MDISLSKKFKETKFSNSINNISYLTQEISWGAPKAQVKKLERLFTGSDDEGVGSSENFSELSFCSFIENDDKLQDTNINNFFDQPDVNNIHSNNPKIFYIDSVLVNKWEKPFFGEDLKP